MVGNRDVIPLSYEANILFCGPKTPSDVMCSFVCGSRGKARFSSPQAQEHQNSRGNKCHLMAKSFLREKTEPAIFGIWPVGYSGPRSPRGKYQKGPHF